MAAHTIIWDHNTVRIWRTSKSSAHLIKEANIEDISGFLTVLDAETKSLGTSHIRIYIDLPSLDHHLERVPKIAPKLQQQLLQQRKIKLYGNEDRCWVATDMHLQREGAHQFYLVSSLPNSIAGAIAKWALQNGVYLEGIFSLPFSLSCMSANACDNPQGFIHYSGLGDAGYLIAREETGNLLFFSRLNTAEPSVEQLEVGANRLGLFIEQEFGINPQLQKEPIDGTKDPTSKITRLGQQKIDSKKNLVRRTDWARQRNLRLRHRAFALFSIALIISFYQTIPLLEKKQELAVNLSSLDLKLQAQIKSINEVQRSILDNRQYSKVIEFSQGRETISKDAPVPAPLVSLLQGLSSALPMSIELDTYSASINPEDAVTEIIIIGRPLTADLDLTTEIEQMTSKLQKESWSISQPTIEFEQDRNGSRFGNQRGRLRTFTLSFNVSPFKK